MINISDSYFEYCKQRYGQHIQVTITIEELSELAMACNTMIQQICKAERGRNPISVTDNLIEELADCYIMLNQFVYTHGMGDTVDHVIEMKLFRDINF
jgi:hypothetical protein